VFMCCSFRSAVCGDCTSLIIRHSADLPGDPAAGWYGSPKFRAPLWPGDDYSPDSGVQTRVPTPESTSPSSPDQAAAVSRTRDLVDKAVGIHHDIRSPHKSPRHSPNKNASQAEGKARDAALTVAHDVLDASVDLIQLVPIPGLQEAASSLIKIWSFVQNVEVSALPVCMTLTPKKYVKTMGSVV